MARDGGAQDVKYRALEVTWGTSTINNGVKPTEEELSSAFGRFGTVVQVGFNKKVCMELYSCIYRQQQQYTIAKACKNPCVTTDTRADAVAAHFRPNVLMCCGVSFLSIIYTSKYVDSGL